MRRSLLLLLFCLSASGQTISYFNQGFLRQPSAQLDREYIGLFGTSGTNYIAGPGIVFTPAGPYTYSLSAGLGGVIQLTGDVTGGPGPTPLATTLKNTGTAGTYTKTTFNAQGLETAGTAAILASADFQNQGTTTTLLHGNAAGNPSWAAVDLAADTTGLLPTSSWAGSTNVWWLNGNNLATTNSFLGSTNKQPVQIRVFGTNVAYFGTNDNIAIGRQAQANGLDSIALGQQSSAPGFGAATVGFGSSATAQSSTSVGTTASASGTSSTCVGAGSSASGASSSSFGLSSVASGVSSGAIGDSANASADFAYAFGFGAVAAGIGATSIGIQNSANGDFSMAAGTVGTAVNQGSFVWSDSQALGITDTAQDQFIVTASGGSTYHTAGNGLVVNDGSGKAVSITNGAVNAPNGFYYLAASNGIVSTNVLQPLHCWAALMKTNTNTFLMPADTYHRITNFNVARTNLMTCSATNGFITNTIAGFYYCAMHMSARPIDNGAFVEGELVLNGVQRDEVGFQSQYDPGGSRYKGLSALGILYLPANSQITFQIKTSGANGIEISRAQMVVMPP